LVGTNFINRFAKNKIPDEMEEFTFDAGVKIANLLKEQSMGKHVTPI
jgi:tyrosyl-tRNA synthetase